MVEKERFVERSTAVNGSRPDAAQLGGEVDP
jgi:hypothetical protein